MKKSSCFIILLIVLCAFLAFGAWNISKIPKDAEAIFGPASPNLNTNQKFLLSWRLIQGEQNLTSPVNPFSTEIPFSISLGESPTSVANRLEDEGIIPNSSIFRDYLIYTGLDTQIQAGNYVLSPAKPARDIAYALLDATPTEVPFAVLAGWRLEEIAESLPSSGLDIPPEIFLDKAQNENLEGYLLPGIYIVPRTISATELLDILSTAFEDALTDELQTGFTNQYLTIEEAVRLASIVEREAVVDNEKPIIASVFLNRLAIGMRLEADPTVQFAVGYNPSQETWWTNPLSSADLQFNSPYNTYLYGGLPPGPICNPSIDSLRAVAFPAQTPYYYFRATCDNSGLHNFAETYDQHLGNACP